jgi:hypothetical protein
MDAKADDVEGAVCRVTKFPVAIEWKRRGARRCGCAACELYAGTNAAAEQR